MAKYIPQTDYKTEKMKLEALAKVDLVVAFNKLADRCESKMYAYDTFLALYNSGEYLKHIYKVLGKISFSTLYRWSATFNKYGTADCLLPKRKCMTIGEYRTTLTPEMISQFEKFLFHPNRFSVGKAISLTKYCLEQQGFEDLPSDCAFRRYADRFKRLHYDRWVLFREGEKAFNDKIEPYIERDISKLEVGDVFVADGHVLNFQVLNPFTGKPVRATLVGFFDWKAGTLVGYEIMMSENTQCIASALRNSILNLGKIPKIVYQDNGRAFRAKYFQNCDCLVGGIKRARSRSGPLPPIRFNESGFNGVYANLGIQSVFAQVRNAKAKVIERFFKEFQEEFEKMMPSYIGTSIEDKPARLKRGELLHKAYYQKATGGKIPTVQETIKCIDYWLRYYNSKPCPHDRKRSIREMLESVERTKSTRRG